jgi:hypothetical protein
VYISTYKFPKIEIILYNKMTHINFSSNETDSKIFSVNVNIPISELLDNAQKNNNTYIQMERKIINGEFSINNNEMLEYIYKYIKIWEDEPKHDYVKQKLITTTIYEHELDKKDISFINEYLDDIRILKEETLTKYNSRNDTLRFHNKKLSILMYQALEFKMESLLKKIYVWVAISIYQMSICDLHDFETS